MLIFYYDAGIDRVKVWSRSSLGTRFEGQFDSWADLIEFLILEGEYLDLGPWKVDIG